MRESIAFCLSLFLSNRDLERERHTHTNMTVKEIHRNKRWHFLLLILITMSPAESLIGVSPETDVGGFDYGEALSKSLLYFEAQRSGRLPYNVTSAWLGVIILVSLMVSSKGLVSATNLSLKCFFSFFWFFKKRILHFFFAIRLLNYHKFWKRLENVINVFNFSLM